MNLQGLGQAISSVLEQYNQEDVPKSVRKVPFLERVRLERLAMEKNISSTSKSDVHTDQQVEKIEPPRKVPFLERVRLERLATNNEV